MLEEFRKYVSSFYTGDLDNDFGIKLKYEHSLRVEAIMKDMARYLKLNDGEILLSSVIGLLHDYGRFYQWKTYRTFSDKDSIDHALYGIKYLFDDGEISRFYNNVDNYDLILEAIKYHNKYTCPDKMFCKMIRDADKIDILHLFENDIYFDEDGEISKGVKDAFDNEKLVDNKNQKTGADKVIKELAFVYDLNYLFSFEYIKKHKIIENIYKNIKNKEKFKNYFDKIYEYIDVKIKESEKNA